MAMRSGELARLAGVTVETLRFYERKNLLRKPARTASGYRAYNAQDLEQVRFIRECQSLGFTLSDIKPLMQLHALAGQKPRSGAAPGERMMSIVRERLATIDAKLEALQRMRDFLAQAVRESDSNNRPICPASSLKRH